MRRTIAFPFLALGLFLFCWINLPKGLTDCIRSFAVTSFNSRPSSNERAARRNPGPSGPGQASYLSIRGKELAAPYRSGESPSSQEGVLQSNELTRLQLENQNLRTQIEHVYDWVLFDQRIGEQFDFLKGLSQKRAAHLRELLVDQLSCLPAQVTYRDPSAWSSSLWVNVGEESNCAVGRTIIAKNSPVLADGALVGVVDYVGKRQARIRLITDSGLSPSVRVCRGATQNRELAHQLQALLNQLEKRDDLFSAAAERDALLTQLRNLKERSGTSWDDGYLAKGEVHGSSAPFWRSRGPILKGIGFNFAYPDEDGSAHDGKVPILKEGDLLVTSGLDGVFPPGLRVGTVTSVDPLKEGSYAYEVEVRPSANNLNDLQSLFILPSLSE